MDSLWLRMEEDPTDASVFAALHHHLEAVAEITALARLYTTRADAVGGEEALYLWLTVAELLASLGVDVAEAISCYRRAYRFVADSWNEGASTFGALKDLFWRRGDWSLLSALLEAEALETPDRAAVMNLWLELIELRLVKTGDTAQAAVAYVSARACGVRSPADVQRQVFDGVERFFDEQGRAEVLVELGLELLDCDDEADDALAFFVEAVGIDVNAQRRLADRLRERLEREPNHQAARAALTKIDEGLHSDAKIEEALGAHGRHKLDEALGLYEEIVAEATYLDNRVVDGLLKLYAYGHQPGRVDAAVIQLCERTESWQPSVKLHELKLLDAMSSDEEARVHHDLGRVLEVKMGDPVGAMDHYQQAHRLAPEIAEYIASGRRLYRRMGNVDMALKLYDKEILATTRSGEAAALMLEKGHLLETVKQDRPGAIEAAVRAAARDGGSSAIAEELLSLIDGAEGNAAFDELEARLLVRSRPLAAQAHLTISAAIRSRLRGLASRSKAYRRALGQANDHDLRAIKIDPVPDTTKVCLERLVDGLRQQGRLDELAAMLTGCVRRETQEGRRLEHALRLADLLKEDLEQPNAVYPTLLTTFRETPSEALFAALEEVFERREAGAEHEQLLRYALEFAPWAHLSRAPETRAELLDRLGTILRERGDVDAARDVYMLTSNVVPNHPAALEYFESRASGELAAKDLYAVVAKGIDFIERPSEQARRYLQLARLALGELNDTERAIDHFQSVVALGDSDPESLAEARSSLADIFREFQRASDLVALLEDEVADALTTDARRIDVLWELVDLHQFQLHDIAGVERTLRILVDLCPGDSTPLLRLVDFHRLRGAPEHEANAIADLVILFDRSKVRSARELADKENAAYALDDDLHVDDLLLRLCTLYLDELDDLEAAADTYERLLDSERYREPAFEQLVAVLTELGDHERLFLTLDARMQGTAELAKKVALIRAMAGLAANELDDAPRAIVLWKKAAGLVPKDPANLVQLAALYEKTESWRDLILTHNRRLNLATEDLARSEIRCDIGDVYIRTGEMGRARGAFLAAVKDLRGHVRAHEGLVGVYRSLGESRLLIRALGDLLDHVQTPAYRHRILVEQVDVAIHDLDAEPLGIEILQRILVEDPLDIHSRERLYDLYLDRGQWMEASETLREIVALVAPASRKVELLLRLAEFQVLLLEDPRAAVVSLREVLALDDTHRPARRRLAQLYVELEQYEAMIEASNILADLAEDPDEEATYLVESALVYEGQLDLAEDAFWCRVRAHELQRDDATHLDELVRLAPLANTWSELLPILEAQADRLEGDERRALRVRIAEVHEQDLHQPGAAFEVYVGLFGQNPCVGRDLWQLERLAGTETERWTVVISLYDLLIARSTDPDEAAALTWTKAEIQHVRLGRPEAAFETLRGAWRAGLAREQTLTRVEALVAAEGLFEDKLALLEDRLSEAVTRQAKRTLLTEGLSVLDGLGDQARITRQLVRLFELDPTDSHADGRLREVAAGSSTWTSMAELYRKAVERFATSGDVAAQATFLVKLAQVLSEHLSKVTRAIDALVEACALLEPGSEAHLALRDIGCTEAGMRSLRVMPDARSPNVVAEIHRLIADQLALSMSEVGSGSYAAVGWVRWLADHDLWALKLDPAGVDRTRIGMRLEGALRAQRRWGDLTDLFELLADTEPDRDTRVLLLGQAADLARDHLHDDMRAYRAQRGRLELSPSLEGAFLECRRILQKHAQWALFDELLRWVLEFAPWAHLLKAPARRAELLVDLAQALEALGDLDRAREVYRLVSSVAPNTPGAIAFYRKHAASNGGIELYRLLLKGLDLLPEGRERFARLADLARVAGELRGDVKLAVEHYRDLAMEAPRGSEIHAFAERSLETIFRHEAAHVDLARLIETQMARGDLSEGRRLGRIRELLTLYRDVLLDTKSLARALRWLVEITPLDVGAQLELADVYADMDDGEHERGVLSTLYDLATAGQWRWAAVAGRGIVTWHQVLLRLARLHTKLSNVDHAVVAYRRLLRSRYRREQVLGELEELLGTNRKETLIDVLTEEVRLCRDTVEKARLFGQMAKLAEQTGDLKAATQHWESAREVRPSDPDACEALTDLYERQKWWADLAALFGYRACVTTSPQQRTALRRRQAKTLEVLGEDDSAAWAYSRILRNDPRDVGALEELAELATARDDLRDALRWLKRWSHAESNLRRRRSLHLEIAEIALRLEDEDLAVATLTHLVEQDASEEEALRRLEDLARSHRHWTKLSRLLGRRIDREADIPRKVDLLVQRASLHADVIGDPDGALAFVRRAIDLEPERLDALRHAAHLMPLVGDHDELADLLEELHALIFDPAEQTAVLYQLAALLEGRLQRPVEAFDCLVQIRELGGDLLDDIPHLYRLAEHADMWEMLTHVLEDDILHVDDPQVQTALEKRLVRRLEDRLANRGEAFAIAQKIAFTGAEWAVDEIFRMAAIDDEYWPGVVRVIQHLQLQTKDRDQWEALGTKIARLQEGRLGDHRAALATMRTVWQHSDHRLRIQRHIERLAEAGGLWTDLVDFNATRWRQATTVPQKIEILRVNAQIIADHLGRQTDQYAEQLVLAFQLDPDNPLVDRELRAFAETNDAWELVINLYEVTIDRRVADGDAEAHERFLRRLISLQQARGAGDDALDACLRLFHLRPELPKVRQQLEALGEAVGRLGEVVANYRTAAEQAKSDVALSFLLPAANLLAGPLGDREEAIAVLRTGSLLDSAERAVAVLRLERLYREAEDYEALIALYAQAGSGARARDKQYRAYLSAARHQANSDEPARAVQYYRLALRLKPNSPVALDLLASLYERLKQWDQVFSVLERKISATEGRADRTVVARLTRLAEHYREARFSERNIDVLRRLVELCPLRRDLFEQLRSTLTDGSRAKELMGVYEDRASRLEVLATDLSGTDAHATNLTSPRLTVVARFEWLWLLHQMADLAMTTFGDTTRAIKILTRCIELEPTDMQSLRTLSDIYAGMGRWPDHLTALHLQLDATHGLRPRAELLRQIAEVERTKTGRHNNAIEALRILVGLQPKDARAHASLARLLQHTGRLEEALVAYECGASVSGELGLCNEERRDLWCRMAEIATQRGERDRAVALYDRALTVDPHHKRSRREVLKAIGDKPEHWMRTIELLRLEIADEADDEDADLEWRIGTIYRDRGQRPRDAMASFKRALASDPMHIGALRDLADVAYRLGDMRGAAEALSMLLDGRYKRLTLESHSLAADQLTDDEHIDEPAYVTYAVRLATAFERIGNIQRAREVYEDALTVRSNNLVALRATGMMAAKAGDLKGARRKLRALLDAAPESADPTLITEAVATLVPIELTLGHPAEALAHLCRAVVIDPGDDSSLEHALELAAQIEDPRILAEHLGGLIAAADEEGKVRELTLRLAEARGALNDGKGALEAYRRALDTGPFDLDLAERIVSLELDLGRPGRGNELARRMVEELEQAEGVDATRLSRALTLYARTVASVDVEAASAAIERALRVDPSNVSAVRHLSAVLSSRGSLAEVADRFMTLSLGLAGEPQRLTFVHNAARELAERRSAKALARPLWEHAVAIDPRDVLAHTALYLLDLEGTPERALIHLRALIVHDGLDAQRLRSLLELARKTDAVALAPTILELLEFAGGLSALERRDLREHRRRRSPRRHLSPALYRQHVLTPLARGPLGAVMAFVVQQAFPLLAETPESHGLSPGQDITDKRNLNIANIFRDVLEMIEPREVRAFLLRTSSDLTEIVRSDPPIVVIGESVSQNLYNKEQRFVLGRAVELTRPEFIAAVTLEPTDFRALFEATLLLGNVDYDDSEAPSSVRRWARRLRTELDETQLVELRERIAAAVTEYGSDGLPRAEDWVRAVVASANRVGFVAAGGAALALKCVLRLEGETTFPRTLLDFAELVATRDEVADLVAFLISEDCAVVRDACEF